ncbi:glycosyltransferase 87 family protein [Leptospira sp. 85282-16]|uniref:glycosyltransferase 87 family protein n=1 Tax=Leptospira sp. 85282-16 TaxID=2971256 RepID=UPI0021C05388|nr:glycosyltransferase 87 family protein [Leptospira sp. 85282-16]MCT8332227.1 glycosyltransferase 87 family protein [Leptospira sp. 85282-16]
MDGNSFVITGLRYVDKDFLSIYNPLGTAPYTYSPQISHFFSLFLMFGEKYAYSLLIFANGFGIYLSLLIFFGIFSKRQRNKYIYIFVPLFLMLSSFFFIINESFFIAQIDLLLLFPLSLFLYCIINGNLLSASILLAFLIQFKPFFLILLLPVLFEFLKNKKYKKLIHFCLPFIMFLLFSPLFHIVETGISLENYYNLFKEYINTSIGISNGFCCGSVSNSLKSILYNLFSGVPQSQVGGTHMITQIFPILISLKLIC